MRRAGVCVVLGSSLRVRPASELPGQVRWKRGRRGEGKLVVVNLQATHVDDKCEVRVWGRVDEVMKVVCEELEVEVEEWKERVMEPWVYEEEVKVERKRRGKKDVEGEGEWRRSERRRTRRGDDDTG